MGSGGGSATNPRGIQEGEARSDRPRKIVVGGHTAVNAKRDWVRGLSEQGRGKSQVKDGSGTLKNYSNLSLTEGIFGHRAKTSNTLDLKRYKTVAEDDEALRVSEWLKVFIE